jgi:glycosyltransferase EpsD
MSNKILFCATVDYHFRSFHLPVMEWFKMMGWEVHVAAKGELDLPFVDKKYNIPIDRSPLRAANIAAYRQLKSVIEQNQYRLIHCHTPMGGVVARLAARQARKSGTKVIYTAHGFHFCKGAPIQNWLLYYPIESNLARVTDCLITINEEDHNLAINRKFKARRIEHVHGVGINTDRFRPITQSERITLRQRNSYQSDDLLLFYAGEFNHNKNQQVLIQAIAQLKEQIPTLRLLLAGEGLLQQDCRKLAMELGIIDKVHFLGYRNDIEKLLPMCDIAVSGSIREGLPVNIMEAMACGLPIIAARNRGHLELVIDQQNGYIVDPYDAAQFANRIRILWGSVELRQRMGQESVHLIEKYDLKQVGQELQRVYSEYMAGDVNETYN